MTDRLTDLVLGVAEIALWGFLVGLVAGAIGWACAEIRFERKRRKK